MLNRTAYLIVFLLSVTQFVNGQYYERVYGNSDSTKPVFFHLTPDGGLIIAGNTVDTNNVNGYHLIRTSPEGNELWSHQYYDAFNAFTHSVSTLRNNEIFLLGSHESALYESSAEVIVLDSSGSVLQAETYPPISGWGTGGVGLCNQSDSTVSIVIYNDGVVSNNFYSVYALNTDLSIRWNDFVGVDDAYTTEHGISPYTNGVYTIAFYDHFFYSTPPLFNATHVRGHDNAGNVTLDSLYEFDCLTTVVTTASDGGALISGIIDDANQFDIALFKIDNSGNVQWQKVYGSYLTETCNSVAMTSDSGFVILSTVQDSLLPGQHDLWLLKVNMYGDSIWSRKFGGTLDELGLHVEVINDDIVILGNTKSTGSDHIYVLRVDSTGQIPASYSILSNKKYFCEGDTAVLYLSPSPRPDMHIQWSNGDTINPLRTTSTGSYYAVITDSSGASYRTPFASVYFASPPNASFTSDTVQICEGTLFVDTASNDITDLYQWYLDGNVLPGENLSYLQPAQSGVYSLTVKNYCSGDSSFALLDTIYPLPTRPVITGSNTSLVCVGDSVHLTINREANISYQWFLDTNQIPFATDTFYYANANGDYTVKAMDINGCISIAFPNTVLYDDFPEYINSSGPTSFCDGGEINLSASNGSQYFWSNNDTTQNTVVDTSGEYYVSFLDVYGCPKISDTVLVTVLQRPVVSLGADTLLCSGSTITLDAGSGFSNYLWSNGTSDQTLLLLPMDPFPDTVSSIVFVVDSNGCPGSDTIQVIFEICAGTISVYTDENLIYPTLLKKGQLIHINLLRDSEFLLFDVTGRIVLKSNSHDIIADIKEGFYTYHLVYGNRISSGKIVVQ